MLENRAGILYHIVMMSELVNVSTDWRLNMIKGSTITVTGSGLSAANNLPVDKPQVSDRIGIGKGLFTAPDDFDANNDEICKMLAGGRLDE